MRIGHIETTVTTPSNSFEPLEKLLFTVLCRNSKIKNLNIGWASGGELQSGVFSRNRPLMPAPIMSYSWIKKGCAGSQDTHFLPYIEHLTLTNCWVIPWALVRFVVAYSNHASLTKVTLNHVSLAPQPSTDARRLGNITRHFLVVERPQSMADLLDKLGTILGEVIIVPDHGLGF